MTHLLSRRRGLQLNAASLVAQSALKRVDRCVTPWLVVAFHRPMYVPHPHKVRQRPPVLLRSCGRKPPPSPPASSVTCPRLAELWRLNGW